MNKCLYCGKETKNKKYCSKECKIKAMTKEKPHCLNCGKELDRCEKKFCNNKCYQEYKRKEFEKTLVYNHCIICGKPTLNEKYCSQECMGKDPARKITAVKNLEKVNETPWTEKEIEFLINNYGIMPISDLCEYLKRNQGEVIKKANDINIKSKRYWKDEDILYLQAHCNDSLESLKNALHKSSSAIMNKFAKINGFQDNKGNSIISVQEFVSKFIKEELKINVLEEFHVGKYITDILVGTLDIEIQGTYWHADPRFYPQETISESQKQHIERDRLKKEYFEKKGIKILYLWEYDIISNPQKCKEIIAEKIKDEKYDIGWPN